jgi:3-phenylpropionate/trans-cinnamate dioxygenase ferredoxin component
MAQYVTVLDADALSPGQARRVIVGDEEVAVYNVDGELFATSDICSHEEASLSEGELFDHVVECPLHGARFDIRTGKPLSLPAVYPVKTYPVRVVEGKVQIEI